MMLMLLQAIYDPQRSTLNLVSPQPDHDTHPAAGDDGRA